MFIFAFFKAASSYKEKKLKPAFYRATLCWRGICCRRVSVCPPQAGILYQNG